MGMILIDRFCVDMATELKAQGITTVADETDTNLVMFMAFAVQAHPNRYSSAELLELQNFILEKTSQFKTRMNLAYRKIP